MYVILDNYSYRAEVESCTTDFRTAADGMRIEEWVLRGWSLDLVRKRALEIVLPKGTNGTITSLPRQDVARQFDFDDENDIGFELHVPKTDTAFDIVFRESAGDVTQTLDLTAINDSFERQKKEDVERRLIRIAAQLLTAEGWRKAAQKINDRIHPPVDYYSQWIKDNERGTAAQASAEQRDFTIKPLVSIVVPVYNVEERWLRRFVESVQQQWYSNWELCIADDHSSAAHVRPVLEELAAADKRIKVTFRTENGRISEATNSAIALATGDLVGFMDNDDELAPQALHEIVKELNHHPDTDFFYTDEDKISEEGQRFDPFFKPDWSPHLLLGHNYITHFTVVSHDLLNKVGPLRSEFNGSQDYDFVLRATEQAKRVVHIPQMLYHWRTIATSVAGNPRSKMYAYEAGRRAIEAAYERRGITATVTMLDNLGTYKSDFSHADTPRVGIIMAGYSADGAERIKRITDYPQCDFINAVTTDVTEYIKQSNTEYVVFLNGIQPDNGRWLKEMLNFFADPTIGVVTGKVVTPQQRIVNVGVTLRALRSSDPFEARGDLDTGIGYYFRTVLPRDIFSATEDCLATRAADFLSLGGFDRSLADGLRGIDYCVRLHAANGRTALFDPYALFRDSRKQPLDIAQHDIRDYCSVHKHLVDPFAAAYYPPSKHDGNAAPAYGVTYSIDEFTCEHGDGEDTLTVRGWAADLNSNDEVDVAVRVNDKDIDADITRSVRFDVSHMLMIPEKTQVGFDLTCTVKPGDKAELVLDASADSKTILLDDSVKVAQAKKRSPIYKLARAAFRAARDRKAILRFVRDRYIRPQQERKVYLDHIAATERYDEAAVRADIAGFVHRPLLSIVVPVYNVEPQWLKRCVESVQQQYYTNWELCLADDCSTDPRVRPMLEQIATSDPRIKVTFREKNGHISRATNSALEIATGDYVVLMDNDDELPPFALYEVAKCVNEHPDVDLIYSDEDKIDAHGHRSDPTYKPDWSPDLLMSTNYISHLGVYRRSIVEELGGFRSGYEGAQDYDLVLRFTEKTDKTRIRHIAKVLYHWRMLATSTASDPHSKNYAFVAGRKALESALERRGIAGKVVMSELNGIYDVDYDIADPALVSVIIPTKNGYDNIERCITSILDKTTYPNYEIIIADNGSTNPKMFDLYEQLERRAGDEHPIRVESIDIPFNFSRINNIAAKSARGNYLLFLNDDTKVIAPDWMGTMVSLCQFDRVGMVGAKLSYPNNRIQHAGVVLGLGGVAGHVLVGTPRNWIGRYGRLMENANYYAVTAACCMIKTGDFWAVNGFDESFDVAYNDVDLCIRVHDQLGKDNVMAHQAELFHFESVTRGYDTKSQQKLERLEHESDRMRKKYATIINNDPYYNPNLTRIGGDMGIRRG
ncbi:glycosyltransferase family 2 protein [Bifidobacterium simiiventris]|uniref:glycosyltransferase family 2 protein n=1 Tax=Bifidobacterium simiiventris TaxID=2834434 RepID=UPI001C59826F|nr:glycosyltransferase [Bifidobacterium simiiventris]MBW3079648.1 glycosyltransferase [Bifidobacterium simiiventris]